MLSDVPAKTLSGAAQAGLPLTIPKRHFHPSDGGLNPDVAARGGFRVVVGERVFGFAKEGRRLS